MCKDDKQHKINVAYNLIQTVLNDTDEELWAYKDLYDALISLNDWFEEVDIQILIGFMDGRRIRKSVCDGYFEFEKFTKFCYN